MLNMYIQISGIGNRSIIREEEGCFCTWSGGSHTSIWGKGPCSRAPMCGRGLENCRCLDEPGPLMMVQ